LPKMLRSMGESEAPIGVVVVGRNPAGNVGILNTGLLSLAANA